MTQGPGQPGWGSTVGVGVDGWGQGRATEENWDNCHRKIIKKIKHSPGM